MKNQRLFFFLAMIFAVLFLAIASLLIINWASVHEYANNEEVKGPSDIVDKYYVEKTDGTIFFNITQTKPSSCHIINFYKTDLENKIVLDLNMTRYTDTCPSDHLVDTISGEMEIEDPESFEIRVDGRRVYFERFFELDHSLPDGYSLDSYMIEKVTETACNSVSDCKTPSEYLIQSRCPFTSLCLDNKCVVVCPGSQK